MFLAWESLMYCEQAMLTGFWDFYVYDTNMYYET